MGCLSFAIHLPVLAFRHLSHPSYILLLLLAVFSRLSPSLLRSCTLPIPLLVPAVAGFSRHLRCLSSPSPRASTLTEALASDSLPLCRSFRHHPASSHLCHRLQFSLRVVAPFTSHPLLLTPAWRTCLPSLLLLVICTASAHLHRPLFRRRRSGAHHCLHTRHSLY